jgi:serine protease DegQ
MKTPDPVTRLLSAGLLAALLALAPAPVPAAGVLPVDATGQPIPTLAPMLERVTPAVVNVNSKTRVRVRDPFADDPFFRHFFGIPNMPRERVQQSLGSGVVVDAQRGYVLTNNHVVDGADDISVTLADGRTLPAKKVGADPDSDVAVIQIEAGELVALPLADSDRLRVGDFVVAVGNPFGVGQSVTSGIVSALGRSGLRGLGVQNFIQTDASINPGNSGGALLNLRGELIGINTAIFSPSGGNVGIGFAIPANLAREVMRQLLAYGEVRRGTLGVQAQDLDEQLAEVLGLAAGRGAVVTRVLEDSPGARAGLKPGDVITVVDGRAVNSAADLSNLEALLPLGKEVVLRVVREGGEQVLRATLAAPTLRRVEGASLDARLAGATLADRAPRNGRGTGVQVARIAAGSRAAALGLAEGDVVIGLNRRPVSNVDALEELLGVPARQVVLTVQRGEQGFYVILR